MTMQEQPLTAALKSVPLPTSDAVELEYAFTRPPVGMYSRLVVPSTVVDVKMMSVMVVRTPMFAWAVLVAVVGLVVQ